MTDTKPAEPTPYIGFGNDQLAKAPRIQSGQQIDCPHCGEKHVLRDSDPPMLLFYKCGENTYLAGIDGRSTMGIKPACSGEIGDF